MDPAANQALTIPAATFLQKAAQAGVTEATRIRERYAATSKITSALGRKASPRAR
jgi:hypothetical protein